MNNLIQMLLSIKNSLLCSKRTKVEKLNGVKTPLFYIFILDYSIAKTLGFVLVQTVELIPVDVNDTKLV